MKKRLTLVACLAVSFSCLAFGTTSFAGQDRPEKISFASFKSGSGWYVLAQTMSRIMVNALPKGSSVDVLPYSGGMGNPILLHQGKANIALGFPVETGLAIKGLPPYKEKMPELKMLVGNLDTYWYLFSVRDGVAINSFQELKGKKFPLRLVVLPKGSSGDWETQAVLGAYGITYKDIESWGGKVSHVSFPTAEQMIKDGQADAFAQVATPGHPSWTSLSTTTRIRFLPIDEKVAGTLSREYGFRLTKLPKGAFRGVDKEIPVLGFTTVLIATEKMPDDIAYAITRGICSNKKELVETYQGADVFDPKIAAQAPLPLHPGAKKYYQDAGYLKK